MLQVNMKRRLKGQHYFLRLDVLINTVEPACLNSQGITTKQLLNTEPLVSIEGEAPSDILHIPVTQDNVVEDTGGSCKGGERKAPWYMIRCFLPLGSVIH